MPDIEIFTGPNCNYCRQAKELLTDIGYRFAERDVSQPGVIDEFRERLPREKAIPQIFINGEHIGGYDDLVILSDKGQLPPA